VRPVVLAAVWILFCVVLIYGLDCGLGFVKDDYAWIATSRLDGWSAVWRLFTDTPMGFYRPIVSLSFGINRLLFGLDPLPYGLTNLALAVATAGVIAWLIFRLGLGAGPAVLGSAVWILNFHGINMAILWTSGRTSLLGTLFAVGAACALTSSKPIACGVLLLLALLSKEEPLMLPVVFLLWRWIGKRLSIGHPETLPAARSTAPVWASAIATVAYLAMRSTTSALTVSTAPDYYQYRLSALAQNILQYLDRSLTLTASLLLLGALFVSRRRFSLTPLERAVVLKGFVWLVFGFALTILIPVRSSLYVLLPSVGSALIVAGVGSAEWRAIEPRRQRLVFIGLMALPIVLVPVYKTRNTRLKSEEVLATNALAALKERLAAGRIRRLIVYDDAVHHPSIADAFGGALPVALRLFMPDAAPTEVIVIPREPAAATSMPSPVPADTLEVVLVGETLADRTVP
jgi:hypothetical protein